MRCADQRRAGERSGNARLSYTVRCGYSEYCWNTNVTSRARSLTAGLAANALLTDSKRNSAMRRLVMQRRAQRGAILCEQAQPFVIEAQADIIADPGRHLRGYARLDAGAVAQCQRDDLR